MKPRRKLLNADPIVEPRPCDVPGCKAEAVHRTAAARDRLTDTRWFCLAHAREFNAAWDYFKGMTPVEIELFRRQDVIGHRPTWPFGLGAIGVGPLGEALRDRIRDAFAGAGMYAKARAKPRPAQPTPARRKALAKLDLKLGSTRLEIKQRYKELVKRYHPDLNGGDRGGEERLRAVNEAYRILMNRSTA